MTNANISRDPGNIREFNLAYLDPSQNARQLQVDKEVVYVKCVK